MLRLEIMQQGAFMNQIVPNEPLQNLLAAAYIHQDFQADFKLSVLHNL